MRSFSKGKFIALDGMGGSGKTMVRDFLMKQFTGDKYHFTREPGGSPLAEKVRDVMMCEEARGADGFTQFCLIWASRSDHMRKTVWPKLEAGITVFSDRFDSSTYAYQIRAQQSPELEEDFNRMRSWALKGVEPDLYIVLDVDPEIGMQRIASRKEGTAKSHFHDRPKDYYERIRHGYIDFARRYNHVIVDANQPADKVIEAVFASVNKILAA